MKTKRIAITPNDGRSSRVASPPSAMTPKQIRSLVDEGIKLNIVKRIAITPNDEIRRELKQLDSDQRRILSTAKKRDGRLARIAKRVDAQQRYLDATRKKLRRAQEAAAAVEKADQTKLDARRAVLLGRLAAQLNA